MRCIIVDDEPIALDIIADYVAKTPMLELLGSFRDPIQALSFLQNTEVELIFLDINMPGFSGIQLLKTLVTYPMIIFTTAYSEFALESYDYNAVDYLLKPISFERFLKAINKANERLKEPKNKLTSIESKNGLLDNKAEDFILVKSGNETRRVLFDDILYIEGSGNYVTFFTSKGKILSLMNLKEIPNLLPKNQFLRIHKSFIISLSKVDVFETNQVKLGSKNIPIGNNYRDDLTIYLSKGKPRM